LQSAGHDLSFSHERAHTPSPHLAHAAALCSTPASAGHGSPKETEPKATAQTAAAISNVLRRFISPSFFKRGFDS
jgi:hypothetical protein